MMRTLLTKEAERLAAEAVAKAIAGGTLEIADSAGNCLVKFRLGAQYVFDSHEGRISFPAPGEETVEKMGIPHAFRVLSAGGACVMRGTAGEFAKADLRVPAKKLFEGMRVSVGGIDYQLKFNEPEA